MSTIISAPTGTTTSMDSRQWASLLGKYRRAESQPLTNSPFIPQPRSGSVVGTITQVQSGKEVGREGNGSGNGNGNGDGNGPLHLPLELEQLKQQLQIQKQFHQDQLLSSSHPSTATTATSSPASTSTTSSP